jgi:hypothetical protein
VAGTTLARELPPDSRAKRTPAGLSATAATVRSVDDLAARRDRLVRLCRTLPEAAVTAHDEHISFQVRGRTFAWYVDDEGGDGRVAVLCKTPPGENQGLVAADPHRFYLPRYVGKRGWVGLRLDLQDVDWGEVAELVADSYRLVAPRRLAGLVGRPPG